MEIVIVMMATLVTCVNYVTLGTSNKIQIALVIQICLIRIGFFVLCLVYLDFLFIYLACTCNQNGTHVCDTGTGECHCNTRYNGTLCDECAEGFANFPYCTGIFFLQIGH